MKILTGFAVVTDSIGKRIAYTYSEVDEVGNILKSNTKESYVVLSEEELTLINSLEEKIKSRL